MREVRTQALRTRGGKRGFDHAMGRLPQGIRRDEKRLAGRREDEAPAAFVLFVGSDLDQAAALKRLERRGERRAVHAQQRRDFPYDRWMGTVQRRHERELAMGEA